MSVPLETAFVYDMTSVETDAENSSRPLCDAADAELVSRARAGEFDGFEELVRRYRNDVFALSCHFVRDREEAWDISQEVFIKAHRGLRRFRGKSGFKTWLLKIAANQCKDYLKKRRLKTVPFEDGIDFRQPGVPPQNPRRAMQAREVGEAIDAAVAKLPIKHRTAFVLREYEGLSYEEMAGTMQCSVGTVMSRLHHARRKLRERLAAMGLVETEDNG